MPAIVTGGDRIIKLSGRTSSLKRPSVPLSQFGSNSIALSGGRVISYAQLYRRQPQIAIAVNKLTRQIARLPLKTYEIDSQNNRRRVREGGLPELLEKPWRRGSANSLKQALAFPPLLHGNGLLKKDRRRPGQPPRGFEPFDWRYADPRCAEGEPISLWRDVLTADSYDPADVIHIAWMAPDGPIGVSPLQQLEVTLRDEDSAREYAAASFRNAVRPSGALVSDKRLGDKDLERLDAKITEHHAGPENALKMMLLTGGLDYKPFGGNAKEAELVDQRKLNREEVAALYDVPPPLVGDLEHATYSNVAELHKMLYVTVLGPWLDLIEMTLQAQLIDSEPAFQGQFVEFDLSEVLKGDKLREISALKMAVQAGLLTLNEARAVQNQPRYELPWADQPLIPTNNLGTSPGAAETGSGDAGGETDPDDEGDDE